MFALQHFQFLRQYLSLLQLEPMESPADRQQDTNAPSPLRGPLAQYLLTPERSRQQIDIALHAALQANIERAIAPANAAARLAAAHGIGLPCGGNSQICTGAPSAAARCESTFFNDAPPPR